MRASTTQTFQERRNEWLETARKQNDMQNGMHTGPETRIKREGEDCERVSILGAGLVAIKDECDDWVNWNGPETKEGMLWWAADDTTVTLADHYGMRTETIDDLDEMALKGATLGEMARFIQDQPIIL